MPPGQPSPPWVPPRRMLAAAALAGLVSLAVFVCGLTMAADAVFGRGSGDVRERLTVYLWPRPAADAEWPAIEEIAAALAGMGEIAAVSVVRDAERAKLLAPWIDLARDGGGIRLPAVIDLRLRRGSGLTADVLARRLEPLAGGLHVDDHAELDTGVARLVRDMDIRTFAVFAVAAVCVGTAAAVAALARVRAGADVLRLVHGLGADDEAVCRPFVRRVAITGAAMSGLGFAAGSGLLLLVDTVGAPGAAGPPLRAELTPAAWAVLSLLPAIAAGSAALAARTSVRRRIGRLF